MIKFTINQLPKMPNQLLRKHWTVISREGKKWNTIVYLVASQFRPKKPFPKVALTLTRFSTREPDRDGLAGSFKYVVDGLVKAGIIVDDKPSIVVECGYFWQQAKQKEQRIEVIVKPLD